MGREVVVAITNGPLDFGPWEQVFYGEFDGRRPKRILVKGIGEEARPGVARETLVTPRVLPPRAPGRTVRALWRENDGRGRLYRGHEPGLGVSPHGVDQ